MKKLGFGQHLLLLVLPALLSAQAVGAQTVQGQLVEEGTGSPIAGALVLLLNEDGKTAARVLTDEGGRFLIRAPAPGLYRLRADRIGFRSAQSRDEF